MAIYVSQRWDGNICQSEMGWQYMSVRDGMAIYVSQRWDGNISLSLISFHPIPKGEREIEEEIFKK